MFVTIFIFIDSGVLPFQFGPICFQNLKLFPTDWNLAFVYMINILY